MDVPLEAAYRKMLVELGNAVRETDLTSMKYMCRDFIPRRRQEEIESALDLWDALEEREKLSMYNIRFLKFLVNAASEGRIDLGNIINRYERLCGQNTGIDGHPNLPASPMEVEPLKNGHHFPQTVLVDTTDLNREIDFIVMSIGRYWRQFARKLGVKEADIDYVTEEHPRNMREQIRQCIKIWFHQGQGRASKAQLIEALRQCQRNDLVFQLESGQY